MKKVEFSSQRVKKERRRAELSFLKRLKKQQAEREKAIGNHRKKQVVFRSIQSQIANKE